MAVIEFVGCAGCGKSTIADTLIENAYCLRGKPYSIKSFFGLVFSPLLTFRALRFLVRAGGWRAFSKTGANWLAVTGALLWARSYSKRRLTVVIFDQLTMQALRRVATHFDTTVSKLIKSHGSDIQTSDVVILVMAPADVISERRKGRGGKMKSAIQPSRYWCSQLDTRRAVGLMKQVSETEYILLDSREEPNFNQMRVHRMLPFDMMRSNIELHKRL